LQAQRYLASLTSQETHLQVNAGVELEKIDILLVDDREENLLALEAILGSPSYNLIQAGSGNQALKYLLKNEPAIILMDVQMPGLDGFETASLIKKCERTREIPIIFLTALDQSDSFLFKGYEYGAVDYIYKPVDPRILRSKVGIFADLFRKTQRLLLAERKLRESEGMERERRIAQLELKSLKREQANEKKYRDLVEGINHGFVWSSDSTLNRVFFVSPNAQRILGYSCESWLAEKGFFLSHVYTEDQNQILDALKNVLSSDKDAEIEHRFIRADGKVIWLHTGIRIAYTDDSTNIEIRGLSVDITRLKQVEQDLQYSKDRSDFLAEASLLLSESLDCETNLSRIGELAVPKLADWYAIDILNGSQEIKRIALAGADPESNASGEIKSRILFTEASNSFGVHKVLHSGKSELYSSLDNDTLIKITLCSELPTILRTNSTKTAVIVPLITRNRILGTMTLISQEVSLNYSSIDLPMVEDLARRIATAIDNSALYQQAQAAIQARNEFLSIASHELKTPLTPLKIQAQALARALNTSPVQELYPDKIKRMLHMFDRQLGRLSSLVEDLLDISKINMGRINLTVERFDLLDLVTDILERFSEQFHSSKCEVSIECEGKIYVEWDKFRIEQVIVNLLTNSIKYGSGKPVKLSIVREKDLVKIRVRDFGIGIAKEDQVRIFECFERAVSGNHFGGLGLGLYIVTQILTAHGGKIQVESELGNGATFIVELPIVSLRPPESNQSAGSAA
jgi:PAS domain S-box-containing protein